VDEFKEVGNRRDTVGLALFDKLRIILNTMGVITPFCSGLYTYHGQIRLDCDGLKMPRKPHFKRQLPPSYHQHHHFSGGFSNELTWMATSKET